MPLGQVTCGQGTYGLYSTLLEDIFLNKKHVIFLKSNFLNIIVECSFTFKNTLTPRNLLEPSPVRVAPKGAITLIGMFNFTPNPRRLPSKENGIIFASHVRK